MQPSDQHSELAGDPVDLTIATYDRVVPEYVRINGEEKILRETREKLAALVAYRPVGRPVRILDAGCGPGRDSKWFAERGFEVVGVDLSRGMLVEAGLRAPGATFIQADLRRLDFPDASFDGIWCSASLLHLDRAEVPGVLRQFRRLLDHGWLYLALKEGQGEEVTDRVYGPGNLRRFTYFSRLEVESLVEQAGFDLRELSLSGPSGAETHSWINVFASTVERG